MDLISKSLVNTRLLAIKAKLGRDYDTVEMIFDLYAAAWESQWQAGMTNGASRQIHGEPLPSPDPHGSGCLLMAPGMRVLVKQTEFATDVISVLPKGTAIHGVTMGNMLVNPPAAPIPLQAPVNPQPAPDPAVAPVNPPSTTDQPVSH
jgi:hypothetical protein